MSEDRRRKPVNMQTMRQPVGHRRDILSRLVGVLVCVYVRESSQFLHWWKARFVPFRGEVVRFMQDVGIKKDTKLNGEDLSIMLARVACRIHGPLSVCWRSECFSQRPG